MANNSSYQVNRRNGAIPAKRQKVLEKGRITVVLGTQWGDEGKGKVVDLLAADADVVCRCQVGYFCYSDIDTITD